jgi:lysozyme
MATRKQRKKKKTLLLILLVLLLMVNAIIVGWELYKRHQINQAKFLRYPAFGIDLPTQYTIHGIDVSKYQKFIHWPSVQTMQVKDVRIKFAFIKATEGLGTVDKQFRRNWTAAKQAGVTRGAYHFFLPTKSGKAQAINFIKTVNLKPGDLPPVLDIEKLYGIKPEKMRKEIDDWLQIVERHYKVKPIIYSYVDFYDKNLGTAYKAYPLWVAHYFEKEKPRIRRDWLFWQHNDAGRVNGIDAKVDFNVFNGDSTAFERLTIK